jgi:hypothetical protein
VSSSEKPAGGTENQVEMHRSRCSRKPRAVNGAISARTMIHCTPDFRVNRIPTLGGSISRYREQECAPKQYRGAFDA